MIQSLFLRGYFIILKYLPTVEHNAACIKTSILT